jgi:CRISPR-associated protein Csb2
LNLRPKTWAGPSTRWASVTPVLLDRFPKRKCGAEAIIARSCQDVGLPPPAAVGVGGHSPFYGGEPCAKFVTLRRAGDRHRLAAHVTLTFDRPVEGPALLGAGRYFGLGLLRPLRRTEKGDA